VKIAESVGGYGEQVTDPEKLQDAPKRGLEANRSGKPAIIDVIVTSMIRRAVVPALEPSSHALSETGTQNRAARKFGEITGISTLR
jgi:thiamine pyrophosphate-dependent acetolactate synthase large subunit-like protein